MRDAINVARKAAASRSTVLLLGESGTGKEVFARAIHQWSERREAALYRDQLRWSWERNLESELFGHEIGAFTGADQLKKGKIELAHGGTVFLDEVGDISAELQTKLLRFLQEREFERVGGTQPIPVDVRVIAATNRDLSSAIKDGRFREDLYSRLTSFRFRFRRYENGREDIPAARTVFLETIRRRNEKKYFRALHEKRKSDFLRTDGRATSASWRT